MAFLMVMVAIDPAGDYPDAPEGPGLTIDESFNVQEGVRLVEGLKGMALFAIWPRELFNDPRDAGASAEFGSYLPDHPPLGRIWLGLWHNMAASLIPPRDHNNTPFITACARVGSAAAFALTVFLAGWSAARFWGSVAGATASISLVLMPRVFGHAHLAALETCVGLTYLIAVLAVAHRWAGPRAPTWPCAALTGLALGAAMLTKIQGILIPVPVILWALYRWRLQAVLPLAVWGLAGLVTFFVLWPWLWSDPIVRFAEYLGRTTDRATLYVWYLGERYGDRRVPWHFPTVMFLTTVPLGLHALGALGLWRWRFGPGSVQSPPVVLGAIIFPLILFSLPKVAVYDGERLFLMIFPLWAIFIGRGGAVAWDWLRVKCRRNIAVTVAGCFLAGQAWGLISVWPCFLSYSNAVVGGLGGAQRLGFELDYWGEAVTRDLLEQMVQSVPQGAHVDVAPVLHGGQLDDMISQSPLLRRREIHLHAYAEDSASHSEYLLLFRRLADLPVPLRELFSGSKPIAQVRRRGVVLAGLYDLGPDSQMQKSR